jgi:hypothetical protein
MQRPWLLPAMLWSGAGYVALMAVGFAVGQHPSPGAPLEEVARFASEHRTGFLVTTYLTCLSQAVLIWFLSGLRVLLGRAEGGDQPLSRAAYGSGVMSASVLFTSSAIAAGLAVRPLGDARRELVHGFFDLFNLGFALAAIPLAGFLAAASLVLVGHGRLRWLGWVGLAGAAAQLAGSAVVFFAPAGVAIPSGLTEPVDALADVLLLGWLVLTSAMLARGRGPERAAATRETAAQP